MSQISDAVASLVLSGRLSPERGKAAPDIGAPDRLVGLYLVAVGGRGALLWLILRYAAGLSERDGREILARNGFGPEVLGESLGRLLEYGLVQLEGDPLGPGPWRLTVEEPLDMAAFESEFVAGAGKGIEADGAAVAATESLAPVSAQPVSPPRPAQAETVPPLIKGVELERVLDCFHNRIGIITGTQIEALREWIEDRGLSAEVLEAAIERVAAGGKRTFNYLEGVLRNMYNSGIRTLKDLEADAARASGRGGRPGDGESASTGVPNSGAYVKVDKELIRKWKETHPDVYTS